MQELDSWIDAQVLEPLYDSLRVELVTDPRQEKELDEAVYRIKKAIREKVLESYHNGQAVGPRAPKQKRR